MPCERVPPSLSISWGGYKVLLVQREKARNIWRSAGGNLAKAFSDESYHSVERPVLSVFVFRVYLRTIPDVL